MAGLPNEGSVCLAFLLRQVDCPKRGRKERGCAMNIKVELNDGERVTVSSKGLDRLLERCLVRRFQRSTGWVVVGVHPVRVCRNINNYNGRERRSQTLH